MVVALLAVYLVRRARLAVGVPRESLSESLKILASQVLR